MFWGNKEYDAIDGINKNQESCMEKIKIIVLVLGVFMLCHAPVFALGKMPLSPKSGTHPQASTQQIESVNPLYPPKYTTEYIAEIKNDYKAVGKNEIFYVALDMLKGTNGEYSRKAILGNNLTTRPMKIEFRNLGQINQNYANYDALGWKKGKNLYIYINETHSSSPAIALAALLSHEALHQDEFNSLPEETYAWTMEAAVWTELLELYPDYDPGLDSLVLRENTLKKAFVRGDYSNRYIKKMVYSNNGYQNLPESSPGFEAL